MSFFKTATLYDSNMKKFKLSDSLQALGFYVVIMVTYYLMGRIQVTTGIYLGTPLSIIFILIPIFICRKSLTTIGLNRENLKEGILAGLVIGIIFLTAYTIIPGIIAQRSLLPLSAIAYNIFYYFVIISFQEELAFRGFIQPRLYPLTKKEWITILLGSILFVLMHYPYQMAAREMTFLEYFPIFISNAPFQFLWHFVCTWLYRKYGNIFASTILHGVVDMSIGIFMSL